MTIVKWDPWPELRAMQEQMTRLLDMSKDRVAGEPFEQGLWQPPVDIYEDEDELVVKMEVPEVEQEDIDVQIEDHTLIIQGVRRLEREEKKPNYQRIERSYGNFRRVFSLPSSVDSERTSARCEKGVLKIVLPKKEQGKPRLIEVTIE
jgi:HSP20 family protein